MRTSVSCFWPFIFTVTMPPPAEASTDNLADLLLELFLHLPELRQHLLQRFDFHCYSSPGRLTFEIWPPNFSSIALTIGSSSNRARNSEPRCREQLRST